MSMRLRRRDEEAEELRRVWEHARDTFDAAYSELVERVEEADDERPGGSDNGR